jgi:hypothetical protein
MAAHTSWGNTVDRSARTSAARAALDAKFLVQADGDPVRAEHLRKAYFKGLALKSAQARRRVKESSDAQAAADVELKLLGIDENASQQTGQRRGVSPPGNSPDVQHQPNLRANEQGAATDEFLSLRTLAREARKIVVEMNLPISGSRTRELVRLFVQEGHTDLDFDTWFLTYADPTGEAAAKRVDRRWSR